MKQWVSPLTGRALRGTPLEPIVIATRDCWKRAVLLNNSFDLMSWDDEIHDLPPSDLVTLPNTHWIMRRKYIKDNMNDMSMLLYDFSGAGWPYILLSEQSSVYNQATERPDSPGYEGVLANIPIVDNSVSWQQIIQFRTDPEATRKYRDLRQWLLYSFNVNSTQEAIDKIGNMLDGYTWSLRKHGMETRLGILRLLVDKKALLARLATGLGIGSVSGPIEGVLTTGLLLTSEIAAYVYERRISKMNVERGENHEIAYLYELNKILLDK